MFQNSDGRHGKFASISWAFVRLGKNTNWTRKIKGHEEKTERVLYKQTIFMIIIPRN